MTYYEARDAIRADLPRGAEASACKEWWQSVTTHQLPGPLAVSRDRSETA